MLRKLLSAALCLGLLLVILPATANAAAASSVLIGQNITLTKGGPAASVGGGTARYDADGVLHLDNVTVVPSDGHCSGTGTFSCSLYANGSLTIDLTGTNTITAPDVTANRSAAIYVANGSLTVQGNGTLTANGGAASTTTPNASAYSYGVNCDGAFTLNGGTVTAVGGNAEAPRTTYTYGMSCDGLTVNGGALTVRGGEAITTDISANSYGLSSTGAVTLSGGTLLAIGGRAESQWSAGSYGAKGGSTFTIRANSACTATAGAAIGSTGSANSYGMSFNGNYTIAGGIYTATAGTASGAIANSYWVGCDYNKVDPEITISGGIFTARLANSTTVNATNYALWKNPILTGVTLQASANANGSPLVDYAAGNNADYAYVTTTDAAPGPGPGPAPGPGGGGSSAGGSTGGSGGNDYTPPPTVAIYNDPSISNATVYLTGSGLSADDLLITERLSSGSDYNAMLRLADQEDVFRVYNIRLQSGKSLTGSAMYLHFSLGASYAGQAFTLVHKKADGTYETFYATADANGDLTFGPLSSLSPFMLVRGTLAQTSVYALADIPATGDNAAPGLWIGILMLSGAGLASSVLLARRKRKA